MFEMAVVVAETITENDGYPPYRRRSTVVKVNQQNNEIDNRWSFKEHINVESCLFFFSHSWKVPHCNSLSSPLRKWPKSIFH